MSPIKCVNSIAHIYIKLAHVVCTLHTADVIIFILIKTKYDKSKGRYGKLLKVRIYNPKGFLKLYSFV